MCMFVFADYFWVSLGGGGELARYTEPFRSSSAVVYSFLVLSCMHISSILEFSDCFYNMPVISNRYMIGMEA